MEKDKNIINPFIIISLCALTLSILSLLILIIYLNYQNNRIIDVRGVSKQYHEVIQNIIKEMNLENNFKGYKELIEKKHMFVNGEYDIYIPSDELLDKTVRILKKKIYESGIGIDTSDSNLETTRTLLLQIDGIQIAKININIKNEQSNVETTKQEDGDLYSLVKSLLLTRYISPTEFVESLPEPVSDGNSMWFHKNYTLFISNDMNDDAFLADIKRLISEKFPNSDIKTNIDKEKNILEHNIFINNKNILTISIQKFADSLNDETTSTIKTSLSTKYDVNKYIEEYFEPVIVYSLNSNVENEQELNDKKKDSIDNEDTQKPKIAIILDDGGFRNPEEDPALELSNKLNISILPDTRYTKELAKKAKEKGFEIMLHMPMQTKQGVKKGSFPCELLVNMTEKEIEEKTKNALEQISEAKGVNNHTGSVFTLKEAPLKSFMKVLKEKKMFFVDSLVVGGSKAYQVAEAEGIPTLKRDMFLDHEYTTAKIKESLEILKKIAKKNGKAIGIGHFRDLTIKVLKEELPRMEEQGFELVHVSEMFE
ncbi:MAG: divergent polysaccharide deacetylase family protein [Candidatus Hydrogenedens sp.]